MISVAQRKRFQGTPVSPGLAQGWAYKLDTSIACEGGMMRPVAEHDVATEQDRLRGAIESVLADLDVLISRFESGKNGGKLAGLRMQSALLRDASIIHWFYDELAHQIAPADFVVRHVLRRVGRDMRQLGGSEGCERAKHVDDLKHRLLMALQGHRDAKVLDIPDQGVLVADVLHPGRLTDLKQLNIAAIVLERASPCSFLAALAQEASIPVVGNIPGVVDAVEEGDLLLVDGNSGKLIRNPGRATRAAFHEKLELFAESLEHAWCKRFQPSVSLDGTKVKVFATAGGLEGSELAADSGADGLGLFRIESLYRESRRVPTEQMLTEALAEALRPWGERPVTVRLLDIAQWQDVPLAEVAGADTAALGFRGIRLLERQPELLQTQMRSLLTLSREYNLRILLPMVCFAEEVRRFRRMLEEEALAMGIGQLPAVGALLETPVAALSVAQIAEAADFVMIGANDLAQYTLAASRELPEVSPYLVPDHPAVLRLIGSVYEDAGDTPVCICGAITSWQHSLVSLLRMGARWLSVPAAQVPIVKEFIRHWHRGWQPKNERAPKFSHRPDPVELPLRLAESHRNEELV